MSEAGGFEPTLCGLKVRCAAATPHNLKNGYGYAFQASNWLLAIDDRSWSYSHNCSPFRFESSE